MKRFLIGCVAALAVLAASESKASAGGGGGFTLGVGVDLHFKARSWCAPNQHAYPPPGYGYGGYYQQPFSPYYAGSQPAAPVAQPQMQPTQPAAAPVTRPTLNTQSYTQQVGYNYYDAGYGYYPTYWYGY